MLVQYVLPAVPLPYWLPWKLAASTHACSGVAFPVGLVGPPQLHPPHAASAGWSTSAPGPSVPPAASFPLAASGPAASAASPAAVEPPQPAVRRTAMWRRVVRRRISGQRSTPRAVLFPQD